MVPPRTMWHHLVELDKKAGTLEVLLALYTGGELRMTELCRSIRLERGTVCRAVLVLRRLEFVTLQDSGRFPFSRTVMLTALGRKLVAAPLAIWPSIFFEVEMGDRRPGRDPKFPSPIFGRPQVAGSRRNGERWNAADDTGTSPVPSGTGPPVQRGPRAPRAPAAPLAPPELRA